MGPAPQRRALRPLRVLPPPEATHDGLEEQPAAAAGACRTVPYSDTICRTIRAEGKGRAPAESTQLGCQPWVRHARVPTAWPYLPYIHCDAAPLLVPHAVSQGLVYEGVHDKPVQVGPGFAAPSGGAVLLGIDCPWRVCCADKRAQSTIPRLMYALMPIDAILPLTDSHDSAYPSGPAHSCTARLARSPAWCPPWTVLWTYGTRRCVEITRQSGYTACSLVYCVDCYTFAAL